MITPAYAQTMARYNRWQNISLLGAADGLTDAQRWQDRGAFFGSIHGTLNHLLLVDYIWLFRFTGDSALKLDAKTMAANATAFPEWADLKAKRAAFDAIILTWAAELTPSDLVGDLTYHSMAVGQAFTKPRWLLVSHMFNHQTHHRGQVHAMLTQAGMRPDDTDVPLMPS
jgi:uncharacterized damage-inducible protein DinB